DIETTGSQRRYRGWRSILGIVDIERSGGTHADLAISCAEACLDAANELVLDAPSPRDRRGECIGLVLIPRADLAIVIAERGRAIRGQPDQRLHIDIAVDPCVTGSHVKRGVLRQVEVQARSGSDVSTSPLIIWSGHAQVPRVSGKVTTLRVGSCWHRVTIVTPPLAIDLGVERQRRFRVEINCKRWKDGESALTFVESVLEPFARCDQSIANRARVVQRAGGISAETT